MPESRFGKLSVTSDGLAKLQSSLRKLRRRIDEGKNLVWSPESPPSKASEWFESSQHVSAYAKRRAFGRAYLASAGASFASTSSSGTQSMALFKADNPFPRGCTRRPGEGSYMNHMSAAQDSAIRRANGFEAAVSMVSMHRSVEAEEETMDRPTDEAGELRTYIRDLTLFVDEERGFKLASGRTSHFIFNLKNLFGEPRAAKLATRALLKTLSGLRFDYIAGIELGAVFPVASAILESADTPRPIRGFIVRKRPKEHGTRNQIEGQREPPTKGTVVVIDDVTTTGGSLLEAIEAIRRLGCTVEEAVTIVDREEGAAENLEAHGVRLIPIFRKSDFLAGDVS